MKSLFIVRHAKSSWKNLEISDLDRPLNARGYRNAYEMAKRLKDKQIKPDLVYTSPAIRALHTAVIFIRYLNFDFNILHLKDEIYEACSSEIIDLIAKTDTSINKLMIFGHNPDFTDLANDLAGENIYNIPTCGIVAIDFDFETWSSILDTKGKMQYYDFPKKK